MKAKIIALALLPVLAACTETTGPAPQQSKPVPTVTRSAQSGLAAFNRVARRMEPVAERSCRQIHKNSGPRFCDFVIRVHNDPKQPANAFQSIGKDGRPVITFNINMIRSVQNDHEYAFILGHEAGHQIATHLTKTQQNQLAGAMVGGILAVVLGGDIQSGVDLGGFVGGRSYSKGFELQADRIGTHIASRAGYNPVTGAKSFNRTVGSSAFLATHPPSGERINTVNQTYAQIKAAKAKGQKTPPITW